jgi:hypothetical protein
LGVHQQKEVSFRPPRTLLEACFGRYYGGQKICIFFFDQAYGVGVMLEQALETIVSL